MTEMTLTIENDSMIPSLKKILGSLKGITSIRINKGHRTSSKVNSKSDPKTLAFVNRFCGKSPDARDADEIINDIYSARVNKMVTDNVRHFEVQEGIKLEDWVKRQTYDEQ